MTTTLKRALRPVRYQVERLAFLTALNLPSTLQRRLAGRPVTIDGLTLAPDTQLMLRLMRLTGQDDGWSGPVPAARAGLVERCRLAGGSLPIGGIRTVELPFGRGRLYLPSAEVATPAPLVVFFHGGGFYLGDLDSHDAPARMLAETAGVRVLSVAYRLAPEAKFPAAYDDALVAFDWAREHAEGLGADPDRIGVGGDSAGGNLAAEVALAAGERCAFQLLIYPVTQMNEVTESRKLFADGFFLTAEAIEICGSHYLAPDTDPCDPRLAPLRTEIPAGTAPAYVATAGFDPLRDEGEAYARRLAEAGVPVRTRRFADQIHGFVNVLGAGHSARAATTEIAEALRELAAPRC
ncbi:MAG: alpha/beta hydrolase [Nocardioides sp.]|uniref:alpha/beta hydrolase n=1 Tax=Nocardioides sp. TaxID=35761 RepID=UPI0039E3B709